MSVRWTQLRRRDTGEILLPHVRWCTSFFCKLRGLTLRRRLPPGEGLLLVESSESRANAAIHMLFVFFPLGVLWLDGEGRVVDTCLARPWRLFYAPRKPARYVLEAAPTLLEQVTIGDELVWDKQGQ